MQILFAAHYSDMWLDKVLNGWQMFSEDPQADKVVVMTYVYIEKNQVSSCQFGKRKPSVSQDCDIEGGF